MVNKITEILIYAALFTSLYFAIFVFYTFFEYRGKIYYTSKKKGLPLVALLVPCYNEEENIEKAIESLRHLEYPPEKLEMIIIDDGSKDNTFLKAVKLAENDKRIKVFRKENGGKYTALNFGMEKIAKAKFVGTVDADSYLHPQSLKKIMRSQMYHLNVLNITKRKDMLSKGSKLFFHFHFSNRLLAIYNFCRN